MLCNVVLESLWAILTSPLAISLMLYFCLIASPDGQKGHSAIVLLDFGVDNLAIDLFFDVVWPWAVFVLYYSRVFCHRVTSQNHYAVGFIGNIIARIWRQAKWDFGEKCWYYRFFPGTFVTKRATAERSRVYLTDISERNKLLTTKKSPSGTLFYGDESLKVYLLFFFQV